MYQQGLTTRNTANKCPILSFSGLYFPAFGPNTDQKNFEYGHFSRSEIYKKIGEFHLKIKGKVNNEFRQNSLTLIFLTSNHCMKRVRIRSLFFRIRNRITPNTDTFYAVNTFLFLVISLIVSEEFSK